MTPRPANPVEIGLTAAVVAMRGDTPQILVAGDGLPMGPFDPLKHRTFELGLRTFVAEQAALDVGYVEQLYTFGDRGRHARAGDKDPHVVSVGYLALTRVPEDDKKLIGAGASFEPWYRYFPWEDWRDGRPAVLDKAIMPALNDWAKQASRASAGVLPRRERVRQAFGSDGLPWDEERTLDRYELLYEAGLTEEARRDGREAALSRAKLPPLGEAMPLDHRRILATAIARLRAKMKYRPVVFELMRPEFTLTDLQRTVEAIAGRHLHKQNFRRLVEATQLVETTGETTAATGGRPAALYRFRRDVLAERPSAGLRFGAR
jgi:hypothetical protein